MLHLSIVRWTVSLTFVAMTISVSADAAAQPGTQGADSCVVCHKDEYKVWEKSRHFTTFRAIHRDKNAKAILASIGGKRSMKRNVNCTSCHYTMIQESAGAKFKARAGPSCESCHGAASGWKDIHGDYGGETAEDETPAHREKRIADSKAAGLKWSWMKYDIAANCMKCHGLARSEIEGDVLGKMMASGHPLNHDFEVVSYSQGEMKHWPDSSPAELAQLFVAGQAAKLISAREAAGRTEDAKYKNAQMKRAADAAAALRTLGDIPEAAALIGSPNEENAHKLLEAVKQMDLYSRIKPLLKGGAGNKKADEN